MAKGKKTGGRQKGSKNRTSTEVQDLVDAIFKKVNPVDKAIKLLEFGSDKTQGTVLLKLMEYRYGKPVQPLEHLGEGGGPILHTIRFGNGQRDE